MTQVTTGLRYNEGKRKWGLLSWPALAELVKVLEFGAIKYDKWNWTGGLSWSECFESLQRHAIAWYQGEDKDAETGLSHMAGVFVNAMFLMHFILFKTGTDDRPSALRQEKEPSIDEEERRARTVAWVEGLKQDTVVERGISYVQENVCPSTARGLPWRY